ncbi:MAG: LysR substrate-binding domain-containing protein [Pseudomonadota bacterium]
MILEDIIDAQILVELRRRLSYVEAARILNLPPATLSRRVIKIEERAGVKFFERSTRSVSITDAGVVAAKHAERLLEEAQAIDHSIEGLRDRPVGVVRVSAPVIFGQAAFGPIVSQFLGDYPDCRLHVDLTNRQIDMIEEGIDVVIRVGPVIDEKLLTRPLGSVYAGLYRRTQTALSSAQWPDSADALGAFALGILHGGAGSSPVLQLTRSDSSTEDITVDPRLVCLNPWLLLETALAADMVVVLPNIVARDAVQSGKLVRVLPDVNIRNAVPIQLAFPSRRLMRPAVRAFIDLAAKLVPKALDKMKNSGI